MLGSNYVGCCTWCYMSSPVKFADLMPLSPVDGKPIYRAGTLVSELFLAGARGTTGAEIDRIGVPEYPNPFGRHADKRGRRGVAWVTLIDGKPGRYTPGLGKTPIKFVQFSHSGVHADSHGFRDTADLISARSAASAPAPSAPAPAVNLPTTAQITTKMVAKSTGKPAASKRGKK